MNILFISSKKRWGGVLSWYQKTALGLKRRKINVTIISHPESRFTKSASDELNIIPLRLGSDYNPIIMVKILWIIKRQKIDLIVTNLYKEIINAGIAAKIAGIPNIRRIGRTDDYYLKRVKTFFERFLIDHYMVPCHSMKTDGLKHYAWLDENKITVIYNGRNIIQFSDDEIINQRKLWNLDSNDFIIGVTSQLLKVKHIDEIIKVFSEIISLKYNVYLVINGEGRQFGFLKDTAKHYHVDKRVIFGGFTDKPELCAAAYNIGLSYSSFEGFPNSIVEYMASGCPVIATNVGGVSEIIEDGVNGFMVSYGNRELFKSRIIELIENKELAIQFKNNAIEGIREKFSEKQMIDNLEKLYTNLLKKL